MQCPRCHRPVTADEKGVCRQCGDRVEGITPAVSNYHRSPVKRGVRQGILIIVFGFLLAALVQVFTKDLQLPKPTGDVIAVLGIVAGIIRAIKLAVFSK